jgi:filamentous hemagglutinin
MAIGDIAQKLGFDEGSPEKIALHAAAGAITALVSGGNIGSGALAGGAEELANGVLQKVLAVNPNLSDAQKLAIGEWAAAFVGAATGGNEGAAASLDSFNYNYLDHPDNDKLNAAKAACAKGDQTACATKAQLEAKDTDQQKAYVDCRSSGFNGSGCTEVLVDAVSALSSYAGTASIWARSDFEANIQLLQSSGGGAQILKIMAPDGVDKLTPEKKDQLAGTVALLVSDPAGILGLPDAIMKASNGDPAAVMQVIALATRLKLFGSGTLDGIAKNAEANSAKTTGGLGGTLKQADTGINWNAGIKDQGGPWEDVIEKILPPGSRLPPDFKTIDFFERVEGVATSAKRLDTSTFAKIANPKSVY